MKTLRKNGGFTLVELIVVIAILAILAGVAVPAYSGYIKKAEDAKVVTELDAIKTACIAEGAERATYVEVKYIDVACGSDGKVTGVKYGKSSENSDQLIDLTTKYTSIGNDWSGTSYAKGATWNGTTWSAKAN